MSTTIDTSLVSSLNTAAAGAATKSTAGDLQDNFLTLLVTQLQNQNPLEPMDNSQMTSQLAQINTVSGIEELNSTLESITGQIDQGQALQAAALVGHGVLVPGDQVLVGSGVTTPFGVELEQSADAVSVTLLDSTGKAVRQFDLGALEAGVQSFTWDGILDDGSTAPDGAYSVRIEASAGESTLSATTLNYALVNGVSLSDAGPQLDLGAVQGQVGLQDVRQIL